MIEGDQCPDNYLSRNNNGKHPNVYSILKNTGFFIVVLSIPSVTLLRSYYY